ncbi:hypothetical protein OTERR_17420 [Oryzomicrobium terrae]|uniref:C-type lysozyme inhibitor domain-containing protein n=1 Tax=Oryzomicrobium terrae TaxID=1735038 RepID=A0A5C1EAB1_9RHOO|nr:hypothetical protein [Oryzomicrobium terrae]QEL65218.1 hypothetical protein OTERR_17420 [Oryzomicrobium terrae]
MTYRSLLALGALSALSLILAACGTASKTPPAVRSNQQLELKLASGTYACENRVRLRVEREIRNQVNSGINLNWNGNSYTLVRDPSYSGLPRFEDSASGLVWIDLPWKSLLLDGKTNTPLVNECRPA